MHHAQAAVFERRTKTRQSMPDREHILNKVRAALGRRSGQAPESPPVPRLVPSGRTRSANVQLLVENFPGDNLHARSAAKAREFVASRLAGQTAVVSSDPILESLGVTGLPNVHPDLADREEMRQLCAEVDVGVSGAAYGLADPAALVMVSSAEEERLVSLLPPRHIAVIPAERVLADLDELLLTLPDPAALTSSMVLIGGPSRTGDIEMILTLGVHGPREVSLLVVG